MCHSAALWGQINRESDEVVQHTLDKMIEGDMVDLVHHWRQASMCPQNIHWIFLDLQDLTTNIHNKFFNIWPVYLKEPIFWLVEWTSYCIIQSNITK